MMTFGERFYHIWNLFDQEFDSLLENYWAQIRHHLAVSFLDSQELLLNRVLNSSFQFFIGNDLARTT